jgi:hypothetical protein
LIFHAPENAHYVGADHLLKFFGFQVDKWRSVSGDASIVDATI